LKAAVNRSIEYTKPNAARGTLVGKSLAAIGVRAVTGQIAADGISRLQLSSRQPWSAAMNEARRGGYSGACENLPLSFQPIGDRAEKEAPVDTKARSSRS